LICVKNDEAEVLKFIGCKKVAEGKYRINRAIALPQLCLIDQHGDALGVVGTKEAMIMAREAELDLVEVAVQASPPICKIVDYEKLKYVFQKKKSEAQKK
jgi:translation initiation factor IF-3